MMKPLAILKHLKDLIGELQYEFNALLKERTWSLVPASQAKKIVGCQNRIGCQSVFKVKRKADGTIERHKARLLAKGYTIKKMALTLMKL